jgi:hypothetical protein
LTEYKSSLVQVSSDRQKLKIPTFGWLFGGLVVVAVVLLMLPSNKQKRFNEAKARLATAEYAAKKVLEPYRAKEFAVFEVAHSVGIGTKIVVWNPKSGGAPPDYISKMPDLAELSTGKLPLKVEWEVPTAGVIYAPDPKSSAYTDLAVLTLVWEKDKHKWEWLDLLRHELDTTSTQPSAIARLKRNIAAANPQAVAAARKKVAANVALCTGLEPGAALYLIGGRLFVAPSSNDYMMRQDYVMVHPNSAQPPN